MSSETNSSASSNSTGRRQFLKSLFGLGHAVDVSAASAAASKGKVNLAAGHFWWADLKTGQVGFPTGTSMAKALPGSLMKLIATATIKEENLLPDQKTYECRGKLILHGKTYTCQTSHGELTLIQALGHSCNIFFAQAADHVGVSDFLKYARLFGMDESCCDHSAGVFPDEPHGDSQHYVLGLAEDLKPQALQILRMAALIATKGALPQLHSAESPPAPKEPSAGASDGLPKLKDGTWAALSQGMQIACREGTARSLDPENRLHIACKTGTAPHGKTYESWICGFFPYEAPRYAFCARAQVGTSQDACVPIAHHYLFATEWP